MYANDHRGHGKTARSEAELGWFAPRDGWRVVVDDLWRHLRTARERHPGVPLVLFAHSMGSFIAQHVLILHGDALAAAVLCGSSGKPPAIAKAGQVLARVERLRQGPRGRSALLRKMSFDDYNRQFRPNRTTADWLSRDAAEVDKYVADPLCGFDSTNQLWIDLLGGLDEIASPELQARIPRALPIHVIAGSEDPVGLKTRGVAQLLGAYRAAGLTNVTHKFYPGARHELLNETNRDEVTADVLAWLDDVLPRA